MQGAVGDAAGAGGMIWWRIVLLNVLTPPLATLTLVVAFAAFDQQWPSPNNLIKDIEGWGIASVFHLPGTLLVATPATLLILQRAPSNRVYVLKLAAIGTVGGALLYLFLPLFGALAGLNAALVWSGLSIGLFKLPQIAREAYA